jgi:hypothetical protein
MTGARGGVGDSFKPWREAARMAASVTLLPITSGLPSLPKAEQRRPVVNIALASPSDGLARQWRSAIAPSTQ